MRSLTVHGSMGGIAPIGALPESMLLRRAVVEFLRRFKSEVQQGSKDGMAE